MWFCGWFFSKHRTYTYLSVSIKRYGATYECEWAIKVVGMELRKSLLVCMHVYLTWVKHAITISYNCFCVCACFVVWSTAKLWSFFFDFGFILNSLQHKLSCNALLADLLAFYIQHVAVCNMLFICELAPLSLSHSLWFFTYVCRGQEWIDLNK